MTRIFTTLASLDALALVLTYIVGWMSRATREEVKPGDDSIYMIHFTLGLSTAMLTLLVHCLIFTYFLGTGRWVKEVGLAYSLPDEPLPKLTRELKRRTFPPALFAMLFAIATAAAGAGAQLQSWPWYVHATLGTLTLLVNGWAFFVEYRNVTLNASVIDQVMREVDRIRAERGLESNAEAIQRDQF